jgi:hypothetical protein
MRTTSGRVAIGLAAAAIALAGCGNSAGSRAGSSPPDQTGTASISQLVTELGQCIHSHGSPAFPDPYIDASGSVAFPPNAPDLPPAAQAACQHIISQLPQAGSSAAPVSQAAYHKWLQFAECMRAHGLPAWPDPRPDGTFPLPESLQTAPSSAIAPAFTACHSLDPNHNGKFSVSQGSS